MFLKKRLDIIASYHDLRTEVRKLSTVVSSIQGYLVSSVGQIGGNLSVLKH
jgi:hypothetical protein